MPTANSGGPTQNIPERIKQGNFQFLNCKVGEKVRPDSDGDSLVLESLETVLSGEFLQIYYKYPNISSNNDCEYLDLLALHPNTGVLVITICDYTISELEEIKGLDWYVSEQPRPLRPEEVVGDGKVEIRHQFEKRGELTDQSDRSIVPFQEYVALPNITSEEWNAKFPEQDTDKFLFQDTLANRDRLFEVVSAGNQTNLPEGVLRDSLAVLKFSESISGGQLNVAATPNTKRELLEHIGQRLEILTDKQLKIGLQAPNNPQQVRGIAGSGKTVVTAFRAAKLHWEHEDWNIAVTFRNHGLRQTLENLITDFYRQFSGGDEPDNDKLDIFHGWGGSTKPGMYSTIANAAGSSPLNFAEAKRKYTYSPDKLGECCRQLVQHNKIPDVYQAILIDEGQDFTPPFFKMCYHATSKEKRIYWSYDEAQNLATLEAKSAEELFGTDSSGRPRVDVSRKLAGGVNGTHVMRTSFRTPRSVLMTAHGFGMGMYREGPVVQSISNKKGWDRLGYVIEDGSFKHPGNSVKLKRPLEYSPHPLWDYQNPGELLTLEWSETRSKEIDWVVNDVEELIKEQNVLPEEILITFLWPYEIRSDALDELVQKLEDRFEETDKIVNDVSNIVRQDGTPGMIHRPNRISLSNIYHSRGNQSPIVYVMGLDMIAEQTSKNLTEGREKEWRDQHVETRNKAFIGFTRTQGWLHITGSDPTSRVVIELNKVLEDTRSKTPELNMEVPPNDSPFKDLEPADFDIDRTE